MSIPKASLQQLFDEYVNECEFVKRLRPETIRSSKESFRHFKAIVPEVSSLADISPEIITVFFKRLQTRERLIGKGVKKIGVKDSTILTYGSRLKTFFKWLTYRKYIDSSPFDSLQLPRPSFIDQRALNGEQIKKIMGAIAQNAPTPFLLKRDMAIVGILTFCGLRRNELVSLEIRDIDLFDGFITVRGETSKSKRTRKLPINCHLKMYLKEYLQERKSRGCKTPYLFVSSGLDHQLTAFGLRHWVDRIGRGSGTKFHLHRFRHTFATNLAMQDVGAIKIQKLMGHSDIKMTQTYLRSVSTEEMRGDVNKLSFENLA
jgi:site-specific recombinase XerD